jgi:hypothetical protein
MKEEELMMKHGSHKAIYRSGNKHEETTNHKTKKVDNGVRQSRLHLWAFVSVGEAFLFLFKASIVHHKSAKWITN